MIETATYLDDLQAKVNALRELQSASGMPSAEGATAGRGVQGRVVMKNISVFNVLSICLIVLNGIDICGSLPNDVRTYYIMPLVTNCASHSVKRCNL